MIGNVVFLVVHVDLAVPLAIAAALLAGTLIAAHRLSAAGPGDWQRTR